MLMKTYAGLWNKYRPAILKMMVEASEDPRFYQLSSHEFHQAFNNQKNGVYTFALEVAEGRVVSGVKESLVAQDLWEMLKLSPKASELIASSTFQISMDKKFMLRVSRTSLQQS